MSYANTPNSTLDVVSTGGWVMAEFRQMVIDEMDSVATVFDPQLSYDSAMNKWLKENKTGDNPMPLFAYNRSISNYGDSGLQRRGRGVIGTLKLPNQSGIAKYSVAQTEFVINFMYITQSMEQIERFEVAYYGAEGIGKTNKITVSMPVLGDFNYFLYYNDLDDITIEKDGSYYKSIVGTIKVRGMYFTFKGQSDLIKEINARIVSSNSLSNIDGEQIANNII